MKAYKTVIVILLCMGGFYLLYAAVTAGEIKYCKEVLAGRANPYDIKFCKEVMRYHDIDIKTN